MLAWIIENKEWLFSGVLVAVIGAVIGWLRSKQSKGEINIGSRNNAKGDQHINIGSSVHQPNSNGGDNANRDKISKG
ncbi:MAG: hypothetical protein D3921_14370 [Candidatus Electrothrix sp. AW1]|nr:hypothetical protein [Candidatus Electrothrix sp. AX1]MCI5183678.1 hypothetical protein [Candidatus Electrothrix gigas]